MVRHFMKCFILTILTCIIILYTSLGFARMPYDIQLFKLGNPSDNPDAQKDFENIMKELAQTFIPLYLSGANTTGYNGFDFGFVGLLSRIKGGSGYWNKVLVSDNVPSSLPVIGIQMRKAIPFSMEFSGNVLWLVNSEVMAMGTRCKWAPVEGFKFIPDIAFGFGISKIINLREADLYTGGFDVTISKKFGVAGMFTLTPYFTFNINGVGAKSKVINPKPYDSGVTEDDYFVFDSLPFWQTKLDRLIFGLVYNSFIFDITFEGIYTIGGIWVMQTKLGFLFN